MTQATQVLGSAALIALEKHKDQLYGRKPYHVHLFDVVNVLLRFIEWDEMPQELIDAAWLHDVLEDTDTPREELEGSFNERVVRLVDAVTNEAGPNRAERQRLTYPKIRRTTGAITLKLADRIANLEQCVSHDRLGRRPGRLFKMYLKEWDSFQSELRGRCRGEGAAAKLMWEHLDELINEGKRKENEPRLWNGFSSLRNV
jgi:hypothetical protein